MLDERHGKLANGVVLTDDGLAKLVEDVLGTERKFGHPLEFIPAGGTGSYGSPEYGLRGHGVAGLRGYGVD
jgi:hypothetical protein